MVDFAGIEKQESPYADFYTGTKDQLIASGLVRADQFPPSGRFWITFMDGEVLRRRYSYKMDERYLRVQRGHEKGTFRVWVGISREVQLQRRRAERAKDDRWRAELVSAERAKAAADARYMLSCMPRTADAFRRVLVREVRFMVRLAVQDVPSRLQHGYALSAEALERTLMSVDAVVEAIMQADVHFDHAQHLALVGRYQAAIAAGHGDIGPRVAKLTAPNAALLADEVQP